MSNSDAQIVQELEALGQSMYQSHVSTSTRRTASLALPRTALPPIIAPDDTAPDKDGLTLNPRPRSRRMSLSPWRSRPKLDAQESERKDSSVQESKSKWSDEPAATSEKKGIWNWKPIRALAHIAKQKLSCLFSVEVVAIQGLPASMNGLRLSVRVRKKESRDGAVQTMPSRVSQGAADFEETLFIRCHVYYTPGSSGGSMKFEPRPFLIYAIAVDADELEFGRNSVDLSYLIQQSVDKSSQGTRVRQWDTTYKLSGKAKGGELVIKLGFQIMEKDGGVGIYSQAEGQKTAKSKNYSPSVARKQSKSSFSVASPRMSSLPMPLEKETESDLQGIDDLNLDEPAPAPEKSAVEDIEFPDFDVEDKGVEIQDKSDDDEEEESSDKRSTSSEVVKEVVQDQSHLIRLTELDSIAQQIKALESMIGDEKEVKTDAEAASQILDADEDKVTREFLQMLEGTTEPDELNFDDDEIPPLKLEGYEDTDEAETDVYLPDLGKGLGCVVRTRNGGYLAATNPLNVMVSRKDTPKLAMQISKPIVIQPNLTGFECFQKMAAIGVDAFTSEIFSLMTIDDLKGKTAEQIAFEGIASSIIRGRNKEGATSSAARTIATVKSMATEMNKGRKERIMTGIWNIDDELISIENILASSLQKIESMAVDALKIQADITEEEAPFDVSPLYAKTASGGKVHNHILTSAASIDEWTKGNSTMESAPITISIVVQLHDPLRQYEAVGGPMITLIHAACAADSPNEEKRYKVSSLQVGGIKMGSSGSKNVWDSEKQRLTALQWLVAYGLGKAGKKGSRVGSKGPDHLWSMSSRVMADMWLKAIRNPDVKFSK